MPAVLVVMHVGKMFFRVEIDIPPTVMGCTSLLAFSSDSPFLLQYLVSLSFLRSWLIHSGDTFGISFRVYFGYSRDWLSAGALQDSVDIWLSFV
jgi:hypothetical protein